RRATKKVTTNGSITLHQRYIYRGYLQLACCDLTRTGHPCLWLLTWDPTQPIATRPLAIRKDGTWYAYGWDLTKNICEVFGQHGYLRTAYTYSPYGEVTADGDVTQPIQWSSEYNDTELALVYYNYRHYNPLDGRWIGRDRIQFADGYNSYAYCLNDGVTLPDILGNSRESKEAHRINARRRQRVGKTLNQIKRNLQNDDDIANQRVTIYYAPNIALPAVSNAISEAKNMLQESTHRRAYNKLMEREARALSKCHRSAESHFTNSSTNSCKQYCCRLEYVKIYGGNEIIGFYVLDIRVASVFMAGKCSQDRNNGGIGPKNSEHYSINKEYNHVL
ncbi:MAG: RHS repeat-associated core domain-containing protein, partial [Akkermansia sp.]|nr:RHS repeat-associated core domain-containing protein [Akkermansia sp.]